MAWSMGISSRDIGNLLGTRTCNIGISRIPPPPFLMANHLRFACIKVEIFPFLYLLVLFSMSFSLKYVSLKQSSPHKEGLWVDSGL